MDLPDILLIGIDTLRADHLGCYGHDQPTSPNIDALARESVRYRRCFSHAPWTIPSFTSILSGQDPTRHRVVASPWNVPNYRPVGFDDLQPTLPELLRDAGYRTFAVDNLVEMASHPSWFVRGFGEYVNLTDRLFIRHHHVLAEQVTDAFLEWRGRRRGDRPWFAFLHYWDPHLPYNYPRRYDAHLQAGCDVHASAPDGRRYLPRRGYADDVSERFMELVAQYDRSIRYADDEIGRLLNELARDGGRDLVVVLTGDHGESMVEHGVLFEHALLYDATIHVPLVVRAPGGVAGVCDDFVQHHDIVPTLLALAGMPPPAGGTGRVLAPFADAALPPREFAVTLQDGGFAMRSLRTANRKLICHFHLDQPPQAAPARVQRCELYDLDADPYELQDVAAQRPGEVQALSARLEAWRQAMLAGTAQGDPLLDATMRVDFRDHPGDPVLVDFYRSLQAT